MKRYGCTYEGRSGDLIAGACEHCGHVIALHPGTHNPALEECLVCWMLDTWGTATGAEVSS